MKKRDDFLDGQEVKEVVDTEQDGSSEVYPLAWYKGIRLRSIIIGLAVVFLLAIIPSISGRVPKGVSDTEKYTATAYNFVTEQTVRLADFSFLYDGYLDSLGQGQPDNLESSYWLEVEAFAPFDSINPDMFLEGTRASLVQAEFLSSIIKWQELQQVLGLNYEAGDYIKFAEQLTSMETQVFGGGDVEFWEIPEERLLEQFSDDSHYAMLKYKVLDDATGIAEATGEEVMFISPYSGAPELAEWAFKGASIGDSDIIVTYYGEVEVTMLGFVSEADMNTYLNSRQPQENEFAAQYSEKLGQWSLLTK